MIRKNSAIFESLMVVFGYRKLIFYFMIVVFLLCTAFNAVSEPKYRVSTSFFIVNASGSNNLLSNYGSLLGIEGPQNVQDLVLAVISSRKLRRDVSKQINERMPERSYNEIVGLLNLRKQIIVRVSSGILTIEYVHQDPHLAMDVIDLYVKGIKAANNNLSMSPYKELIKILDPPVLPVSPYKPNFIVNYILSMSTGFIFIVFLILLFHAFKVERAIYQDSLK